MAEIEKNTATGPGSRLTKARRAAGLSREQVADKLHLSITVIRQIESDQYDEHIPDAFARGYLRNYAKLLELEPQEIIAKYSQMIGSSKVKNYYAPSKSVSNEPIQTHMQHWMIWLAIVLVVVLATFWFMSGDETVPQASENMPDTSDIASSENPQQIEQALNNNSMSNNEGQTPIIVTETNAKPETMSTNTVPTGFQETTEAVLEFYFVGDCWVQVTDANGEVMAVGLKTAGRRFEVSGIAPINIVLGKPRQVDISYNKESVDLSCFPSATTARFELNNAQACDGI